MLSRNPKDYFIVTKHVTLEYHGTEKPEHDVMLNQEFREEPKGTQMTFWIVAKDGRYSRRYSIDSCPKWVKNVYELKTKE